MDRRIMYQLQDISAQLDAKFGAPGTKSQKEAERKAYQVYDKQMLIDKLIKI